MKVGYQIGVMNEDEIPAVAEANFANRNLDIVVIQFVVGHCDSIAAPSKESRCEIFCRDEFTRKRLMKNMCPVCWKANGNGSVVTKTANAFQVVIHLQKMFPGSDIDWGNGAREGGSSPDWQIGSSEKINERMRRVEKTPNFVGNIPYNRPLW